MKKIMIKYIIIETYPNILKTEIFPFSFVLPIYYYSLLVMYSLNNLIKKNINFLAKKINNYNNKNIDKLKNEVNITLDSKIDNINIVNNGMVFNNISEYDQEFFYNSRALVELKDNYDNLKNINKDFDLVDFLPNASKFILKKYTIRYNDNTEDKDIKYSIFLEFNEVAIVVINQITYIKNLLKKWRNK